uniref:Immunoglobulin domain-containing protein n=1 Tax=Astatotilapia calliptera TaxID=8154 RepID=A0AAX7TX42_ASTCA
MKMRLLSVILLHGVCVLHLSALTVSADHKQFFSGSALAILTCVDGDGKTVDGWTVKRTRGTLTERCGAAEGLVIIKSLCQLKLRKPSDGAYFCESSSGQRSDEVNIIVSGSLMLDIPSSPVWTGSNVTLLCQSREGKQGNSDFYKSVERIGFDPEGKWILINVQKSDEGLYSCSAGVDKKSPEFRLTVRDPPPNVKAPSSTPITHSSRTSSPQSTSKKDPENTNKKKPRGNNKPKKQDEEDGWYWSPSSGPPLTASIMSGLVSVVLLVLV